ncbi:Mitochondrial 2-oxoadipate and 2-oxoglutarate transporter, partial [Massospora cicadina]
MLRRHESLKEIITPRESVNSVIRQVVAEGELEAFNVLDVGEVNHRLDLWERNLPNVMPFYAVKAFPRSPLDPTNGGAGDGLVLAAGVSPDRIIFANPCKLKSHMRHAANCGIQMSTFDSANELEKIKALWPTSQLFLRIWVNDSGSSIPLNTKYGAAPNEISSILAKAKGLELDVVGISFHVGSNCLDPDLFITAIRSAKQAFLVAQDLGFNMTTLNIGGGMPGKVNDSEFEQAAAAIRAALAENFLTGIRVIAEPGRYFATPVLTCACSIIGKRVRTDIRESNDRPPYKTVIWGPTCASQDMVNIKSTLKLPELEVGDWFYFKDVGSYSLSMGFTFNGFQPGPTYY